MNKLRNSKPYQNRRNSSFLRLKVTAQLFKMFALVSLAITHIHLHVASCLHVNLTRLLLLLSAVWSRAHITYEIHSIATKPIEIGAINRK